MNVVVLQGTLSRPAAVRRLPSGDELVALEVTVRPEVGPTDTVPVVWPRPPARARTLAAGTEVVVTGRVRRRYFRAGGATASRTEVVADSVVAAGRGRRVIALLDRARARITIDPVPGRGHVRREQQEG
ncbi:MAG: single-stranded DNA-binding protein [Acidimicrobiales bacterium]|nr:single-stranded DNA-binding protein [Acidimicrobiales bacterium]